MFKRAGFWFFLWVSVFWGAGQPPIFAQDLVTPLYNQGMKLYSQKDYAGAIDYLGQVCDLQPSNQQARYYLVYSMLSQRQFSQASKQVDILCSQDPNNASYSALKTQIQQALGVAAQPKPPRKEDPKIWSPAIQLARQTSSLTIIKPSTTVKTSLPPSLRIAHASGTQDLSPVDQVLVMIERLEYASASGQLEKMMAKDPKNAQLLHLRGMVEHQQGNLGPARGWFEKALKLNPDLFNSQFLIGDTYLKEGKLAEAEAAFTKLTAKKEDTFALLSLAEAKRGQGKADEAIAVYERILKNDEKSVEARIYLAEVLLDKGESQQAADMINQVLTQQPQSALARYVKGKILLKGGLLEEAIVSVKQAISLSPENSSFKTLLAQVYLKSGRQNEALELAGAVTRNEPQAWEARMVLAEGLYMIGDFANALEHLIQVEAIVQSPAVTLLRARIMRKTGDNPAAMKGYQLFLSQDQSNPEVYFEYGALLEEMNEFEMACEVYLEIKKSFPDTEHFPAAENKWSMARDRVLMEKAAQQAQQNQKPPSGPANTGPNKIDY